MPSQSNAQQAAQAAQRAAEQDMRDAEQLMQQAQRAMEAAAQRAGEGIEVRNTTGGKIILLPDGKGGHKRIEISDGAGAGFPSEAITLAPPPPGNDIPRGVIKIIEIASLVVVAVVLGTPLVRSLTRWFDRRTAGAPMTSDVSQRLASIEQAVETVAIEVERISEGQRFTSKLLSERQHDLERVR